MSEKLVITFIRGSAAELNKSFVRTPGTEAVIEVCDDTYNFLYNSLIEKATDEKRAEKRRM
jgi:hypothetical protein